MNAVLLLVGSLAWAAPADDLLGEVDAASNKGDDAHLVLDVKSTDKKGRESERTMEIWQKGDDKRKITFTAPARLDGVALLVPDGDTLYLYLPSYGRARRIVGEARGDAFVGTDFSMEDLARLSWASEYTPTLLGDHQLELNPKPEADAPAGKVLIDVWPESKLPKKVEHYNAEGKLIRRIQFDDVRDIGSRPLAHSVSVEDVENTRSTKATVTTAEIDTGLDDSLFTLTSLQR